MDRFDLICEDGRYVKGVSADAAPQYWQGSAVTHILRVRGLWRMPLLGIFMRNFWAKKHGAIFDPDWIKGFY